MENDADAAQGSGHNEQQNTRGANQTMTPRRRKLLIWTAVLTMPLWGRDIIETVVPGALGVFIFCAGKLKAGVKWLKSFRASSVK